MLPTYITAYRKAITDIMMLDTATDGDPDAQKALADVCGEYARAVRESAVPDIDLLLAYSHILEAALDKALAPKEEPEPPTVSKMETVDGLPLEEVCTREAEPKPRKRIDHIIEYVREHPGLTKSEIAEAIGCPHTGVYYPITKLVNQGILRTETDVYGRVRYFPTEGSA